MPYYLKKESKLNVEIKYVSSHYFQGIKNKKEGFMKFV